MILSTVENSFARSRFVYLTAQEPRLQWNTEQATYEFNNFLLPENRIILEDFYVNRMRRIGARVVLARPDRTVVYGCFAAALNEVAFARDGA